MGIAIDAGSLFRVLAPELILTVGAMVLLLATVWKDQGNVEGWAEGGERTAALARWSALLCAIVAVAVIISWGDGASGTADQRIAADGFRWAIDLILLLGTGFSLLLLEVEHGKSKAYSPEVPVLMLLALVGMMILVAARDLMLVFLGIELMSIAVYVLAGVNRRSARGAESAMKYFLLGSFSTGFLLYGMALLFGATGSTRYVDIAAWAGLHPGLDALFILGVGLIMVGFAFKVAAAPFHLWTPDVYDGAPLPVTAFMAAVVKTAAFAAFIRLMLESLGAAVERWHPAMWWLAAITMVVGNVLALSQRNLVRLLAYSSIAHAGYLLVAIASNSALGSTALIFYTLSYTLATMGAFAVLIVVNQGRDSAPTLDDIAGLWLVRPGIAVGMAIFFLTFLGMPLVGGMGFFAKWYILQSALQATVPQTTLSIVLVLASVVSAAYYLNVVSTMFMRGRVDNGAAPNVEARVAPTAVGIIAFAAVLLLVLGVYPTPAISLARRAVSHASVVQVKTESRPAPVRVLRSAELR